MPTNNDISQAVENLKKTQAKFDSDPCPEKEEAVVIAAEDMLDLFESVKDIPDESLHVAEAAIDIANAYHDYFDLCDREEEPENRLLILEATARAVLKPKLSWPELEPISVLLKQGVETHQIALMYGVPTHAVEEAISLAEDDNRRRSVDHWLANSKHCGRDYMSPHEADQKVRRRDIRERTRVAYTNYRNCRARNRLRDTEGDEVTPDECPETTRELIEQGVDGAQLRMMKPVWRMLEEKMEVGEIAKLHDISPDRIYEEADRMNFIIEKKDEDTPITVNDQIYNELRMGRSLKQIQDIVVDDKGKPVSAQKVAALKRRLEDMIRDEEEARQEAEEAREEAAAS